MSRRGGPRIGILMHLSVFFLMQDRSRVLWPSCPSNGALMGARVRFAAATRVGIIV